MRYLPKNKYDTKDYTKENSIERFKKKFTEPNIYVIILYIIVATVGITIAISVYIMILPLVLLGYLTTALAIGSFIK